MRRCHGTQLLRQYRMHVFSNSCNVLRPHLRIFSSRVSKSSASRRDYATTPNAPVTKVEKILLDTIKATGPISFATYMQMCLSHPTEGYYMNPSNPVLGTRGDFTTSPEISQVFGELVAIWLLSQWLHAGEARSIRLVELGPGRGTLMHDVLRVLSQFPAAQRAVKAIHLIETSPPMRTRQEEKLSAISEKHGWKLHWHTSIDDVSLDPSVYTMLVAHEFFDALPFHLIQKTEEGWKEIMISSAPDPAAPTVLKPSVSLDFMTTSPPPPTTSTISQLTSGPRFRRVLSPTPTPSSLLLGSSSARLQKLPVGSQVEISPTAFKISRRICELVHGGAAGAKKRESSSGSALIVDYGDDKAFGNSFRAFKDHKIVDVFHRPGECDLTVNVDFAYLREATAELALCLGPLTQATFLTRMGFQTRVDNLKQAAQSVERGVEIEKAARRLVDVGGMGGQYKVMGVVGLKSVEPDAQERWPFVDE